MKGLENNSAELFRLMDRVRKAWQSVTPCEHLSKSQFGTAARRLRNMALLR